MLVSRPSYWTDLLPLRQLPIVDTLKLHEGTRQNYRQCVKQTLIFYQPDLNKIGKNLSFKLLLYLISDKL